MNYHLLLCSVWLYGVFGPYAIGQKNTSGTAGIPSGDKIVQVVSDPVIHIHSFYWLESKKNLYVTELVTDKLHIWDYETSRMTTITPMTGELIAFYIPFKNSDKKAIIGSFENLRIFEGTERDFKVSDPVLKIEKKGYVMYRAQCDSNGVLYILAKYQLIDDTKGRGSILYIVKDKKLQQMKKFDSIVLGFHISVDNKNMYVITDAGKKIMKYNLDANGGKLSEEKTFFTVDTVERYDSLRARGLDFDGENNLYVAVGLEVIKIDEAGKLQETIKIPFVGTALTFGGYNYKNLFTGTSQLILPYKSDQVGSILDISGFARSGQKNNPVNW